LWNEIIQRGERSGFSSVQAVAARLAELLADRDILLVIDDGFLMQLVSI
jgi:hypothetical protein